MKKKNKPIGKYSKIGLETILHFESQASHQKLNNVNNWLDALIKKFPEHSHLQECRLLVSLAIHRLKKRQNP
jgi:hypothetical protein